MHPVPNERLLHVDAHRSISTLVFPPDITAVVHETNLCLDGTFRNGTIPCLAAEPLSLTVKAGTTCPSKTEISMHQAAVVLVLVEKEMALVLAGCQ